MTDAEAASYVLAYLLNNNYSQSATIFLQECNVLPSKTLLVLPDTPLQSIIADHKSRKDTNVLVNTMGTVNACKALWSKLDHTLHQLRTLCEDNFSPAQSAAHKSVGANAVRSRPSRSARNKKTSTGPPTPVSQPHSTLSTTLSQPHTSTVIGSQPHAVQPPPASQHHNPHPPIHTLASSPRKRKTIPKRKPLPISPSASVAPSVAPQSPSVQHVLDSLMEDNELPGKLAEIINRCVSREDIDTREMTSGLTPSTLEDILDLTYADPSLEGLISNVNTSADHTASSLAATDQLTDITGDQDHPPHKRQRTCDETATLTEQDIDDFLDQLHNS